MSAVSFKEKNARFLSRLGEELSDRLSIVSVQISTPKHWGATSGDLRALYCLPKGKGKIILARLYDDGDVAAWLCNSPHLFSHPEELRKLEKDLNDPNLLLERDTYTASSAANTIVEKYEALR